MYSANLVRSALPALAFVILTLSAAPVLAVSAAPDPGPTGPAASGEPSGPSASGGPSGQDHGERNDPFSRRDQVSRDAPVVFVVPDQVCRGSKLDPCY